MFGILPRRNLPRALKKAFLQPRYATRVFLKRFISFLTYLFGRGYSAPPETVSLFLTYRCNLRCPMCGQWGEKGSFRSLGREVLSQGLTMDEIESLMDDLASFRPNLTLFGGEPMLYRGWIDVVRMAKARGMRVNIVTNGVLLKDLVDEVIDSGLDEVVLSLDGPEDVHDRMRGVRGTFRKAMEGLRGLKGMREKGHRVPLVSINCTIYEENFHRLKELVPVAEAAGAGSITFHHLLFLSRDACDDHNRIFEPRFGNRCNDWYGFVRDELPRIDVDRLLREMEEIQRMKTPVKVSFYPNFTEDEIRRYYGQWDFSPTSYSGRCKSLWMTAYIFPDGSVRPYHSMEFIPGNIRRERFTEIWNNERYREYRRFVKRIRRFPVCSRGCTELYRY